MPLPSYNPPASPPEPARDLKTRFDNVDEYLKQLLLPYLFNYLNTLANQLFDQIVPWVDLVGTKDGVNQNFTVPYRIRLGINARPQAWLFQAGAPIPYFPGIPPPFTWTLVLNSNGSQTVVLGTPPGPSDYVAFEELVLQ